MEIWHLVLVAVVTVIVEDVMHRIFDALWGFVSRKLGRRLGHQTKPQPAPVVVDQEQAIQTVMDLFPNAKAVRLRGNHNKYLSAKEDEISVTQDKNGSSNNVRWTVKYSPESENKIRLKSCYGKYLTASNKRFILGLTGFKVLQMAGILHSSEEWEPILEGNRVKLRTQDGNFLRANGGVWPWLDSVTHDVPWVLQDLILWDVDVVDFVSEQSPQPKPGDSSPQPKPGDSTPSSESNHPLKSSSSVGQKNQTVMEVFHDAQTVRLRSHHKKFLVAKEDKISVTQDKSGSSNACWTVESSSESKNEIRLKSCYNKYLAASNERFLLGITGRKVLQVDGFLDSSVEWQPIWEGNKVKLRTPNRKYLRANDNVWPWRDSVTHGVPYRTAKQDWTLWDVDEVEIVSEQSPQPVGNFTEFRMNEIRTIGGSPEATKHDSGSLYLDAPHIQ